MNPIALDFETYYSKKNKYSVATMIPEQYASHSLFDPYLVSVSDGEEAWAGPTAKFNWESIHGRVLLSHNKRFDETMFLEMKRRGWVPAHIQPAAWHCTANLTAYLCNRRSLADSVEHLLGKKISKDVRSNAIEKRWADFNPDEQAAMIAYARNDAVDCHALWTKFSAQWPILEQKLSNQTIGGQALYEGFGFRKVARRRDYYPAAAGREDALVLSRAL